MTHSFANEQDGLFTGATYSGPARLLASNTPAGCVAVPGLHDPDTKRWVDGEVVDYVKPKPDDTALTTWELDGGRWVPVPTLEGLRLTVLAELQSRAAAAEGGTDRALRQMVLATPGHPAAPRMQAIEDAVTPIRAAINEASAAVTFEALEAIRTSRP